MRRSCDRCWRLRKQPKNAEGSALRLAQVLKRVRPELDLYLVANGRVEEIAGSPEANAVRRVFYAVEELLELHLAILEGVQDRYDTPFFNNLKNYAQRPIGTFHALPIARGKSIFKSDWIRDMGEFYGPTLFLAESSATTGGLDSLLEPTGNIKKAQEMAARAFGADHVFFVTNGTSTSNKMAVQALLAPGDIAIVDRNCHKSHHYGMVLAGAQPLYVEAFPMTEYSMYGAVPLRTIKQALLNLKADGRLASRQDGGPDELHIRRPHLQHPPGDGRMPGDQAGPDLPVGRGLVRLCPLLAVPAAAHRDGRGRRYRSLAARSEVGRGIREAAAAARRGSIRRCPAGDAPDSRSAQGQAARLSDELDAQVDVGAAAGLDAASSRTSISTPWKRSSTRPCSPTLRPARTSN